MKRKICDWFCVRVLGPMIELNGRNCAEAVSAWYTSENLWQTRSSIVAFANIAKDNIYTDSLLESSTTLISRDERFSKTAVGWILRELSRSDRETVTSFINDNIACFSKESIENSMQYFAKGDKQKIRVLFKQSQKR